MEHRISTRHPLQLTAELWRGNKNFAMGTLRNIGRFGFFLETGAQAIETGDFFIVKITIPNSGNSETRHVKAIVIHKSTQGIGLMGVDNNMASINLVNTILGTAM